MHRAAGARVQALGVLPDDDEVEVLEAVLAYRAADTGPQLGWPQVDVQVELEPQPQQQTALEHARRHGRRAHRAQQDRVGLAQFRQHRIGQHLARRQVVLAAEGAGPPVDGEAVPSGDGVHARLGDLGYLGSDAVAWQVGDDVRLCRPWQALPVGGYLVGRYARA